MVVGLDIFKKYFELYPDSYVIIGGTACDIIIAEADDFTSLSAILLNDEYYNYMIEHSQFEDGLRRANIEALICLKVIAFLEIKERIENGSKEDSKQMKKHKADIFRLTVMLTPDTEFLLPTNIQNHVNHFIEAIKGEIPDKAIFKEMGLGSIDSNRVYEQLKKSFRINK